MTQLQGIAQVNLIEIKLFLFFTSLLERCEGQVFGHPSYCPKDINTKVLGKSWNHDAALPQIQNDINNMQNFYFFSKKVSNSLHIHFFIVQFQADSVVSVLGQGPISYQTVEIKYVEIRGLGSRDLPLW